MPDLLKFIVLALIGATAWGVWLGWSGKAVFFMDANDLKRSFMGCVVFFVGILLAVLTWKGFFYVSIAIAIYFIYDSVHRTFLFNNKDWRLALPVSIAKIILSGIYTIECLQILSPNREADGKKVENRLTAIVNICLFTLLIAKLVNGAEVFAQPYDVVNSENPSKAGE